MRAQKKGEKKINDKEREWKMTENAIWEKKKKGGEQ